MKTVENVWQHILDMSSKKKPQGENKMKDELIYVKIEANGFQDICNRLAELEEENKGLKLDNDFLQRQNAALKMRCSKYAIEIRELTDEVNDLRFTHKYLTSEEAGKQFAQELLGGA